MDLQLELKNIEKYLFPKMNCDPWERAMYYHLLVNTRIANKEQNLFGVLSLEASSKMGREKVRQTLRSMNQKGCIQIVEKDRNGHLIKVFLPSEIEGLVIETDHQEEKRNIEDIDFYKGREFLNALLDRDNKRCIYCLKKVTPEKCVLDHIISQAKGGNNSYKNIGSGDTILIGSGDTILNY